MKTSNFLASLLPSFGKDQVIEDIRLTRGEINDVTQPAYDSALPLLKSWKFKAEPVEQDMQQFARMVKGGNIVQVVQKGLKTVVDNLDEVEALIGKTYNEEVAGAGLTYQKAQLLQFVEACAFVSKYARKYLIYIYVMESAQIPESGTVVAESLTPAEIEWLKANFVAFCTAWNIVTTEPGQVKKAIADIPDIVVTSDNASTLAATVGEKKLDPFQMRLIPVWMNPIYHVGMMVAEWQAARYKAAQEELKLLQLRKLNLERLSQGKPDARVQKEIEYMESRIQGLNFKIAKMEKSNG